MVTQNDQLLAYDGVRLLPFRMLCTTRVAGIATQQHGTELGDVTKAATSQEHEAVVMRHRSKHWRYSDQLTIDVFSAHIGCQGMLSPKQMPYIAMGDQVC